MKKVIFVVQMENGPDYRTLFGHDVAVCPVSQVWKTLETIDVSLVVLECGENPDTALGILSGIKKARPSIPVVIVVATSNEDVAIRAFRGGARDYFRLPLDDEFVRAVHDIPRLRHEFQEELICVKPADETQETGSERSEYTLHARLARSVEYVKKHSSEPLTLEEVAQVACLSKYHFCRLFKKYYGTGFMQYLMSLRIRKTITLLRESDLPVTLVALKAGFRDVSEFNRQFKKVTGITPTAFRKSQVAHS